MRPPLVTRGQSFAFALVGSLFFLWAIANNFNDILVKQFQKALDLTRMQSGLVQTAFYFGYFTFALPAGWVITKVGYKNGIVIGLCLYAIGAALFYPAAASRTFVFFLVALYVIAAGLAFIETAANPLVTMMGAAETGPQRLNLAQSFNGFGAFLAPIIGGALIFSGVDHSRSEIEAMSPAALDGWRASEALAVQGPYLALAGIVIAIALLVWRVPFPEIADEAPACADVEGTAIRSFAHLRWAVVTQFFYVGAQVSVWSYFINFVQDLVEVSERSAAYYLGLSLMMFMLGRFIGTGLMRFIAPPRMLTIFGIAATILCLIAIIGSGWTAVVALGLTSLFMSIMFPTVFALGIADLGSKAKLGSSLIIMAIIGGALFPPLVGLIADTTQSIQAAMVVPLLGFVVVGQFGRYMTRRGVAPVAP
jgi:MFS transporter, FHS family, L-fucose permease